MNSDFVKNIETYISNKEFSLNFLILNFNSNLPTRSLNQESSLKHSIFKRGDFCLKETRLWMFLTLSCLYSYFIFSYSLLLLIYSDVSTRKNTLSFKKDVYTFFFSVSQETSQAFKRMVASPPCGEDGLEGKESKHSPERPRDLSSKLASSSCSRNLGQLSDFSRPWFIRLWNAGNCIVLKPRWNRHRRSQYVVLVVTPTVTTVILPLPSQNEATA